MRGDGSIGGVKSHVPVALRGSGSLSGLLAPGKLSRACDRLASWTWLYLPIVSDGSECRANSWAIFTEAPLLTMFGVAEDHDSNPLKIGLGRLKTEGRAKFVSVNPVRTGYSAIADEWIGIRPGTDGLFVLALVHELLRAQRIDTDYLVRYTNAPWLVILDPGEEEDGPEPIPGIFEQAPFYT